MYKWADKEVLTACAAAEYLGVSRKSIYRWAAQGFLKPVTLPGEFLISKESIKKMFEDGVSFRQARKSAEPALPEFQGTLVYQHNNEFITITEASELYEVPLNVMQHWLRRSDLEFERFRNIRFYKREEVDALVKKRKRNSHPEITAWYSVDEIMTEFGLTRKQVYNFTGTHKSLPKKKENGITYYSKRHVDNLLRPKVDMHDYYSPAEVVDKYGIDLRRLYKVAKRVGFDSYTSSGKIWYKKADVDAFFQIEK